MSEYLTGKLLVALPSMDDAQFERAIILVCEHNETGAMGLVINHKIENLSLSYLLSQVGIQPNGKFDTTSLNIMEGGPLDRGRGFLLHSPEYTNSDTITINERYAVTGTLEALRETVSGRGPEKMLFVLGHVAWDAGQLEEELLENAWIVVEDDPDLIFDIPAEERWDESYAKLGIDLAMLHSNTAGCA